jgi:catalase
VQGAGGGAVEATKTFASSASVLFDAFYVPGGEASIATLRADGGAAQFLREAHAHYKPLGATGDGVALLTAAIAQADAMKPESVRGDPMAGVVTAETPDGFAPAFIAAIAQHRHWERDQTQQLGVSAKP